jgi:hypothetical protein
MSEQTTVNDRAHPSRTRWFLGGFGAAAALLMAGLYLGGYFNPAVAEEPNSTIIEAK